MLFNQDFQKEFIEIREFLKEIENQLSPIKYHKDRKHGKQSRLSK